MPDYCMFKSGLSRNMQLMLETKLKLKQLRTCMLNQKMQQQQSWVWWLPEICHFVCIMHVIIQICLRILCLTRCARGDTICLRPLQVDNIFIFIHQVAVLFWHVGYLRHQQQVYLWPFDLETGVWVTYDVGYLYLCQFLVFLGLSILELGPMYVTDRCQTKASLSASTLWG